MKVINDAVILKTIEDKLNANFPEISGEQPKFKASVASIDFNFFDDESISVLHNMVKEYFNEIYNGSYIIRQKSTFSRLKPILSFDNLKKIHTHQIVFFEYDCGDAELHPLHIIPEDGFLKNVLNVPWTSYPNDIILSSHSQNRYKQIQKGIKVKKWEDLFKKLTLEQLVKDSKHQSYYGDNLTVSVSLGEGKDFNGKAGFVVTYEEILNALPEMRIKTDCDKLRYEMLQNSLEFIRGELFPFGGNGLTLEDVLSDYEPNLSRVFSGSNGGGFFDPYYNGINTLCCTIGDYAKTRTFHNCQITNTSYNILTGDIPAAFMLYFPVTNLNEGKYEGYYQGQREIPIPKGEFV